MDGGGADMSATPQAPTVRIDTREIIYDRPLEVGIGKVGGPYRVTVDPARCVWCYTCVFECTHNLSNPARKTCVFEGRDIYLDAQKRRLPDGAKGGALLRQELRIFDLDCCNCKRCVAMCPTNAITVDANPNYQIIGTPNHGPAIIFQNLARSEGKRMTSSMTEYSQPPDYEDFHIDASIILNPQRDNANEFAGRLSDCYLGKNPERRVKVNTPALDTHMSYGSNSHEAFLARLMACVTLGRPFFVGEGYLHPDFAPAFKHCILQFGTGGFGPWVDLDQFMGVSMKYGQDAKKGKGGKLPAPKNDWEIALIRCIEPYRDVNSPNPQHLQYSIEELRMRIASLRAALGPNKLVGADVYGTIWNVHHIVVALARAGFDYITLRGGGGGTGAASISDLQNRGLSTLYIGKIAHDALVAEGLRSSVSLIGEGGFLNPKMAMLGLMVGYDFIGTGARHLVPLGCTMCRRCHTGQCSWGITARPFGHRIDPEEGRQRIVNMMNSWRRGMEGLAAGLGFTTHEDVVGSRRFRYHGANPLLYETFGKAPF
jgi:glutamate synthase domain-containing protein 2/NAD-dependent dihydropyrimidine dehydrogenase PreA subunit